MEDEVREKMSEIPKESFKSSFNQFENVLKNASVDNFSDLFLAENS